MSRRWIRSLPFAAALTLAAPAAHAANLWIAWDSSTTACMAETIDFYHCILDDSNFNQLALAYTGVGEPLTLAGTKVLTNSCAPNDFNCVVNSGTAFQIKKYDVVMHYYGSNWQGGTNGTATVNGVLINTAWVNTGNSCEGQTCTGAHEAFEAATDGTSADCCNGQVHSSSCPNCDASCGKYTGNSGNPPWGCYDLHCPNGTYKMELLSKAGNQYDASGCTEVSLTAPSCTGLNQACDPNNNTCCTGDVCEKWSLSGTPPYSDFCCLPVGATCSKNTDCCGGSNCNGGKCGCVPSGQWCINDSDCCSGLTCDASQYKCVTKPSSTSSSAAATSSSSDAASSTAASSGATSGVTSGGLGGAVGTGGEPGLGGAAVTGSGGGGGADSGTGGDGAKAPNQKGGCACTTTGDAGATSAWAGLLALVSLAFARGRRSRSRAGAARLAHRALEGGRELG